jgi:hypothetical protein
MDLVLIKIDSPEWNYMWNWLEAHPINEGLPVPCIADNEGEQWQYMGSLKQGDKILHQFRHRNHPVTGTRQEIALAASAELTEEQIHRKDKL